MISFALSYVVLLHRVDCVKNQPNGHEQCCRSVEGAQELISKDIARRGELECQKVELIQVKQIDCRQL